MDELRELVDRLADQDVPASRQTHARPFPHSTRGDQAREFVATPRLTGSKLPVTQNESRSRTTVAPARNLPIGCDTAR